MIKEFNTDKYRMEVRKKFKDPSAFNLEKHNQTILKEGNRFSEIRKQIIPYEKCDDDQKVIIFNAGLMDLNDLSEFMQ